MFARWSLRFRIFLFFALILGGGGAGIAGGLWLGFSRLQDPEAATGFVLAGLVAFFALAGLVLWVWLMFDENVAKPVERLSGDMRARTHADVDGAIEHAAARYLGDLGPAAAAVTENLLYSRNALAEAVARETQAIAHQKKLLEQTLRDVPAGVVICTADHRITLYNQNAIDLFPGSHTLGLDRSIFDFLFEGPVRHALEELNGEGDDGHRVDFLVSTREDNRFLTCQMRLMPNLLNPGSAPGYMLALRDMTRELQTNFALHLTLRDSLEKIRRPTANLATVLAAMENAGELTADQVSALQGALKGEVRDLTQSVSLLSATHDELLSEWWPMSEVAVSALGNTLGTRFPGAWFSVGRHDPNLRLRCDSFGLTMLLAGSILRLRDHGADSVTLEVFEEPPGARIDLVFEGPAPSLSELETWLDAPLDADIPDFTGRDVLLRHGAEFWPERLESGHARLCLPLREARYPHAKGTARQPVEFYDFALMEPDDPGTFDERPLTSLQYVVFDTETTGLLPEDGDEIVQIAAVRIVNQRLLTGEMFDTLVNPGRPIPARSTEVHGITEAMVEDAPPVLQAIEKFHRFSGDAVLIAHNAPFDMAFLRRAESALGLRFGNTVLDTVLLSAMLYGRTEEHSLDALAARLGVEIAEEHRHTALGDSIATAQVFLKMLPLLEQKEFRTLGATLREFKKHASLIKSVN